MTVFSSDVIMPCLCCTVACAACGIQFNIRPKHLAAASVGAFMSQFIYVIAGMTGSGEIKSCLIAAAAAELYSVMLARRMKTPANMFLITSIIPLVPGGKLYYAMSALVTNDIDTAAKLGLDAFETAIAIAVGIFIITLIQRVLSSIDIKKRTAVFFEKKGRSIKNIK